MQLARLLDEGNLTGGEPLQVVVQDLSGAAVAMVLASSRAVRFIAGTSP